MNVVQVTIIEFGCQVFDEVILKDIAINVILVLTMDKYWDDFSI